MHNKNKLWIVAAVLVASVGVMGTVEAVDDEIVLTHDEWVEMAKQGFAIGYLVGYMEGTGAATCAFFSYADAYPHADVSDPVLMAHAIADAELESMSGINELRNENGWLQYLLPDPLPTNLSDCNSTILQDSVRRLHTDFSEHMPEFEFSRHMPELDNEEYGDLMAEAMRGYVVGGAVGFSMGVLTTTSAVIEDADTYPKDANVYDPTYTAVQVMMLGGTDYQSSLLNDLRNENDLIAYLVPDPLSDYACDYSALYECDFSDIEAISEWTGWVPDDGIDEPAIVFDLTLVKDSLWLGGGNAPSSGKMFRILAVKVENRGYDEFEFDPYDCFIVVDNVVFDHGHADSSLTKAGYTPPISSGTLLDGGKLEGYMYFEIPETLTKSFGFGCTIYGKKDYNLVIV